MGHMAELDKHRKDTSILTRCRRMLSTREKPPRRESVSKLTSSWLRRIWSPPVEVDHMFDDDCVQLLDTSSIKCGMLSHRSRPSSKLRKVSKTLDHTISIPPWCRLPSSTHFTTLTYVLFVIALISSSTSAAPLQIKHTDHLVKRQAIPDSFGNTGNKPASVAPEPPPSIATHTGESTSIIFTPTSIPTLATLPPEVPSSSPARPSTTTEPATEPTVGLTTTPTPTPSSPLSSSISTLPNSPLGEQLQRTSPASPFTPGLIAGVAGGTAIVIALLIGIGFLRYRRNRRNSVQEIPIRRSRLGLRMFGSHREASRSPSTASKYTTRSSRRGSTEKGKQLEITTSALGGGKRSTFGSVSGWLDKATIGRPKPAYVDTSSQYLELPRPLFADREKDMGRSEGAPWRPKRPDADAAPLGRLSGMGFGLGMGRASGIT